MSAQAAFAAACLDGGVPVPAGLVGPGGRAAGRRFDVYRNNVVVGLMEALRVAFPAVAGLVGAERFGRIARGFVARHPPTSPLMMHYGGALPGALAGCPAVTGMPWLPDVARLELLLRESYHAADAGVADAALLGAVPAERLAGVRLIPAPATRAMASPWPVLSLWRAGTRGGDLPDMAPEEVLIAQPGFDPVPQRLPAGGAAVVAALARQPLGPAADASGPDIDLTGLLRTLIASGALSTIEVTE